MAKNSVERYKRIIEILDNEEFISADKLENILNVSKETVRRDLNYLAEKDLIVRTHGGASSKKILNTLLGKPRNFENKANDNYKKAICKQAAKLIKPNDTIYLEYGTTVTFLLNYIPRDMNLNIISNSVRIIELFRENYYKNWHLTVLGGDFDYATMSLNNYLTSENLRMFRPNKAFFSCLSVTEDMMVTDRYIYETSIKKQVINNSKESYLLIDHSKLFDDSAVNVSSINQYDRIYIDNDADKKAIEKIKKTGVDLILVDKNDI